MHNRVTTRVLDKPKERKVKLATSAHLIAFECSVDIATDRKFPWSIPLATDVASRAVKHAVSITRRQYVTKVLSDMHFGDVWSHHRVPDVSSLSLSQYNNTFIIHPRRTASEATCLSVVRDPRERDLSFVESYPRWWLTFTALLSTSLLNVDGVE